MDINLAFLFLLTLFLIFTPDCFAQSRFGKLLEENYQAQAGKLSAFGYLLKKSDFSKEEKAKMPIMSINQPNSQLPASLTVAVLGDSMVDVLQDGLPQLRSALKKYFPNSQLSLYNFGVGATDMEYGLYRLSHSYQYLNKSYPSVLSINPDILVVESFAYNNFGNSQQGLDKQWLLIAEIIETIKKASPKTKIILASTIAPNSKVYGDGIDGIDWPMDQKLTRAQTVKSYLENMINFANSQGYPLADAYHLSLDKNSEGRLEYISVADYLHPSGPGGVLFCNQVAKVIFKIYTGN